MTLVKLEPGKNPGAEPGESNRENGIGDGIDWTGPHKTNPEYEQNPNNRWNQRTPSKGLIRRNRGRYLSGESVPK